MDYIDMIYDTIDNSVTMAEGGAEGSILAGRFRIVRQLGQGGMGAEVRGRIVTGRKELVVVIVFITAMLLWLGVLGVRCWVNNSHISARVGYLLGLGVIGGWWWVNNRGEAGKAGPIQGSKSQPTQPVQDRKTVTVRTLTLPGGATMEMIYVAPGWFMMGSPANEDGRENDETQHRVTLTKGYWLGKYEVTQAQWRSVMGDNPSNFKGANRPVENVSWDDCQQFIQKVNDAARRQFGGEARLPTEAEWEYACRAETTTAYCWGNALNGDKANCDGNYPCGTAVKGSYKQQTTAVGSYQSNAWGFCDMHGNVWEWCSDWYGNYTGDAVNPRGPASGDLRVLRGGSWSYDARYCRSAYRYWGDPGIRIGGNGFRLCCSAGPRE